MICVWNCWTWKLGFFRLLFTLNYWNKYWLILVLSSHNSCRYSFDIVVSNFASLCVSLSLHLSHFYFIIIFGQLAIYWEIQSGMWMNELKYTCTYGCIYIWLLGVSCFSISYEEIIYNYLCVNCRTVCNVFMRALNSVHFDINFFLLHYCERNV